MTRLAALAALAASIWAMAWWPGAAATPLPLLVLWAFAFAAYLIAVRGAASLSARTIWTGAVLLRLGLLPAPPVLSEDIYRYVWDGWVSSSGVNPYAFAPADPGLAGLRTDWWSLINHPEVSTIYPGGAQILFLALAAIGPAWPLFKLAWIGADLLVGGLLARLAGRAGVSRHRALVLWLWSPLVLVEIAWSGHFEAVGIAAMLGAMCLLARRGRGADSGPARASHPVRDAGRAGPARSALAGAVLGLGASLKLAPLAAVPALWRRRGWRAAIPALLVPALLFLPFAAAGAAVFDGLRTYADIWRFNPGLFVALERAGAWLPGPAELPRWMAAGVVAGVALVAAARRWSLGRALFWTIGAGLIVSPTIHPWYVLWVLPFAILRGSTAWLAFSGTVFLAYAGRDAYLTTGEWPEPLWLALLIHGPLLALLAREGLARPDRRPAPDRLGGGGEVAEGE